MFNGTAANSLALASLCQSYHGVICADSAHVETDECGAPEFFSNGSKLLVAHAVDGKLRPESIHELATKRQDIHYPKPRVVTITQSTETGSVYSADELQAISAASKAHGLSLHMDGARFANACAHLGLSPAEMTWKSGVDVLCFGGTKNGMAVGEAVLFFDHKIATDFDYRCKQAGQLASKMRFLAAPWVGLLESGAWLTNARHANDCAAYFQQQIADVPGVKVVSPVQANTVFLAATDEFFDRLRSRGWRFYTFIGGALHVCLGFESIARGCAGARYPLVRDVLKGRGRVPSGCRVPHPWILKGGRPQTCLVHVLSETTNVSRPCFERVPGTQGAAPQAR